MFKQIVSDFIKKELIKIAQEARQTQQQPQPPGPGGNTGQSKPDAAQNRPAAQSESVKVEDTGVQRQEQKPPESPPAPLQPDIRLNVRFLENQGQEQGQQQIGQAADQVFLAQPTDPSQIFPAMANRFRARFGHIPNTMLNMFSLHWQFIAPLMPAAATYYELRDAIAQGQGLGGGVGAPPIHPASLRRGLDTTLGRSVRTVERVLDQVELEATRVQTFDNLFRTKGLIGAINDLRARGIDPYSAYLSWRQYHNNMYALAMNPEQKQDGPLVTPYDFGQTGTIYSDLRRAYQDLRYINMYYRNMRAVPHPDRVIAAAESLNFLMENDPTFVPSLWLRQEELDSFKYALNNLSKLQLDDHKMTIVRQALHNMQDRENRYYHARQKIFSISDHVQNLENIVNTVIDKGKANIDEYNNFVNNFNRLKDSLLFAYSFDPVGFYDYLSKPENFELVGKLRWLFNIARVHNVDMRDIEHIVQKIDRLPGNFFVSQRMPRFTVDFNEVQQKAKESQEQQESQIPASAYAPPPESQRIHPSIRETYRGLIGKVPVHYDPVVQHFRTLAEYPARTKEVQALAPRRPGVGELKVNF